ncbi:hypothetical protein BLA29_012839, partial [Euroglyphus maynei]
HSDRVHTSKIFGSPVSKLRPDTTRRSFLEWFLPPQRSRRHIPSPRATTTSSPSKRKIIKSTKRKSPKLLPPLSIQSSKIDDSTSMSSIISRSTHHLQTVRNISGKKSPMRRLSSHKLHLGFSGFEVGVVPKAPPKRLHRLSSDLQSETE